jgi:RNA polymerase sigma factor (sigma-70 family)
MRRFFAIISCCVMASGCTGGDSGGSECAARLPASWDAVRHPETDIPAQDKKWLDEMHILTRDEASRHPTIPTDLRGTVGDDAFQSLVRHFRNWSFDEIKKEIESPKAYVRGALYREYAKYLRRNPRRENAMGDLVDTIPAKEPDPEAERAKQALFVAVESLDKIQKSIITMRYFEGLTRDGIAKQLKLSPSQVRTGEIRALERLRRSLNEYSG